MKCLNDAAAVLAGLIISIGVAIAATPPAVYTAAQASAGATLFTQNCALCHGADLKGGAGPALLGQAFAAPGDDDTIGAIFSQLAAQMPQASPGSLTHTQYEDVMSYILQQNGYPAGTTAFSYSEGLTSSTPLVSMVK
jgi:mono/diheme cytochrome c family protein